MTKSNNETAKEKAITTLKRANIAASLYLDDLIPACEYWSIYKESKRTVNEAVAIGVHKEDIIAGAMKRMR